jgi:ABC-type dipeptide/oligopeptide/nickel transport system permease subunit
MQSSTLASVSARPARPRRPIVRANARALAGGVICGVAVLCALFAPFLVPHNPSEQNLLGRIQAPGWRDDAGRVRVLGTDQLGRDVLSRILVGARTSLAIAALAALISAAVGVAAGILGGYFGGIIDLVVARLVEVTLAFPALLLAIALIAVLRPSVESVIVVLAITGWVTYARLVRAQVLALREREFVVAVQALGGGDDRVIRRHLFPNLVPILLAVATIQLAQFILAESALSFLGLGAPPTVASWGGMINEGRDYIWNAWWIETFPGIAIVLVVSGVGLLGDWLRDRADPRLRL